MLVVHHGSNISTCCRRISFTRLVIIPWCQGGKVSAVMFCKQFLAYPVHIDWCYHSIHKHSTCTYIMTSGMHRRPFEGRHLVIWGGWRRASNMPILGTGIYGTLCWNNLVFWKMRKICKKGLSFEGPLWPSHAAVRFRQFLIQKYMLFFLIS